MTHLDVCDSTVLRFASMFVWNVSNQLVTSIDQKLQLEADVSIDEVKVDICWKILC